MSEQSQSETDAPVTMWIRRLEAGDAVAAQPIWQHFCERVMHIARCQVPARVRTGYDEDDVAVSAFHSLFTGIAANRFDLRDRDDLWRLLLTIAERKISHRIRAEYRDKRDVRRLLHDSLFAAEAGGEAGASSGLAGVACIEPAPELAAEVSESVDKLLKTLGDDQLRRIAWMKLENYTAEEIAVRLGCTRKTVQRKLLIIRQLWKEKAGGTAPPED